MSLKIPPGKTLVKEGALLMLLLWRLQLLLLCRHSLEPSIVPIFHLGQSCNTKHLDFPHPDFYNSCDCSDQEHGLDREVLWHPIFDKCAQTLLCLLFPCSLYQVGCLFGIQPLVGQFLMLLLLLLLVLCLGLALPPGLLLVQALALVKTHTQVT